MSYLITFGIILIFAITLTILFKKRIEEVIIIGIVEIIVIIYCSGLLDNLRAGIIAVEILAIMQLIYLIIQIIKRHKQKKLKPLLQNIFTPGLMLYAVLFIGSIIINRNRIFEHHDEFIHWAVIVKNMFMYNTYGTNIETIVRFNEYPPFTAIFQYLFLETNGAYAEDIIMIAQNILYFSIIVSITKNVKWDKSLKSLIVIIPLIIFIPIIFYENFYLEILVDGILGIMFAYTIFSAFEADENLIFKYVKILVGSIMLCLTKTSGIALAVLAIVIILIKCVIDKKKHNLKKEIRLLIGVILISILLTSIWYVKVSNSEKRWDFTQYVKKENMQKDEQLHIAENFVKATLSKQDITERGFTVFSITLLYLCFNLYAAKKYDINGYKYYSMTMIISIPIYLVALLISYSAIFDIAEAKHLACFDRYVSTILLAYPIFQILVLSRYIEVKYYKEKCLLMISLIFILLPMKTIEEKYINGKSYILTSNEERENCTKIKEYKEVLKEDDKILFITGLEGNLGTLVLMNKYEIMPLNITQSMVGIFISQKNFENIVEDFDYMYVYRMREEDKEKIKNSFTDNEINDDTLYKVICTDEEIKLEKIKNE